MNKLPLDILVEKITVIIQKLYKLSDIESNVETSQDLTHGDLSSVVALKLAKHLKRNPFDIANEIKTQLLSDQVVKNMFDRIEVVKPGYLNFFLSSTWLLAEMTEILTNQEKYGANDLYKGKKI